VPDLRSNYGRYLMSPYFITTWHLSEDSSPLRLAHQPLTIEPAGIMRLRSETRTLAQAAKDGKVPAHEVCCHP
jgi:hypothetical protein